MAVIEDGTHAVSSSSVVGCRKANTGAAPNPLFLLFVYFETTQQVCSWNEVDARDDFYKKLVSEMPA